MKNSIIKRLIIICLALAVVLSGTTVNANIVLTKKEATKYINTIAKRQMRVVKNPSHSSAGGEWTVMGLARAGKITTNYKNIYKRNLKKALDSSNGELSKRNYTDYSRTVIALTSIGENPYNYYGYDVISPLAEFDNVVRQGLNGVAYALIALNSGGYDVSPRSGYDGRVASREKYKDVMVSSALPKGGWALLGKKADVDMTAIAIQSLAPYYHKDEKAKDAINEGLKILSEKQKSNGGFESMGNENCESSSQVLTTLSTLGISVKDKRFVKNKKTVLDSLMKYYDNGAFKHLVNSTVNQMTTDQAFYSLVAYRNQLASDEPLFNMKKVAVNKKYRKTAADKKQKTKVKKKTITKSDDKIKREEPTTKQNKKKNKNEITKERTEKKQKNPEKKKDKKKEAKIKSNKSFVIFISFIGAILCTVIYFIYKKRSKDVQK